MTDDARPSVILYRLGDLPFVRTTLLSQHPLPEWCLSLPYWISGFEADPEEIFDHLPEAPADPEHGPMLLTLLRDLSEHLTDGGPFYDRVFARTQRYEYGYHTSEPYDVVRCYFERSFDVVDVAATVMTELALRDDVEVVRASMEKLVSPSDFISEGCESTYDYLVGGGTLAMPPEAVLTRLVPLFEGRRPSAFTEFDHRLLSLFARSPEHLSLAEATVDMGYAPLDQHALWREKLLSLGVTEDTLEAALVEAAPLTIDELSPRAAWLVGRAARDLPAFLQRHRAHPRTAGYLLRNALAWHFPPLRAVGEALVRDHLDALELTDLNVAASFRRREVHVLLGQHRSAIEARFQGQSSAGLDHLFIETT